VVLSETFFELVARFGRNRHCAGLAVADHAAHWADRGQYRREDHDDALPSTDPGRGLRVLSPS